MTGGLVVLDKAPGPTSHDVVDRVRRILSVRRVGHTGTLDPFATGVLPVLVGKATRLARFLSGGEKEYAAQVRFGFATTTDDGTGDPLGPERPEAPAREALEEALRALAGSYLQVPPAFSAKRVGGRRLYEMARRGSPVTAGGAPVTVHRLRLVRLEGALAELEVCCSSGTYVRAIARDLGDRLGCGGHLVALRRTRSGEFSLRDACPIEALAAEGWARVQPLSSLLAGLPAVEVGAEGRAAILQGRDLTRGLVVSGFPESAPERVRVLDGGGALLGLAVPRGFGEGEGGLPRQAVLHPEIVLAEEPA